MPSPTPHHVARLPQELRQRVARCAVTPGVAPFADLAPAYAALLASLVEATDGRGLPRVAGFTFDPVDVRAVFDLPHAPSIGRTPVAVHPRLGALIRPNHWALAPVLRAPMHTGTPLRYDEPTPLGASWDDALRGLLDLDDALRRRWALWISLGPPSPWDPAFDRFAFHGRFEPLEGMHVGARREQLDDLASTLSLRAAGAGRWGHNGAPVLWRMGADALLASDDDGELDAALRWASARRWPAQPDSYGVESAYGSASDASSVEPAYRVVARGPRTAGLHAQRAGAGDPWVWSSTQGDTVDVRRPVHAATVARSEWPAIDAASPRLRAYIGERGLVRLPARQDVEAVRQWVAREAPGWEALVEIEAVLGGLALEPPSGILMTPGFLGVHAIRCERDALEPVGLAAAEGDDDAAPPHGLPWPFVRTHGRELAVVGLLRERFDDALCVDRAGVIYHLDHEFGRLLPLAASPRAYLERRALETAQWMRADPIGHHDALLIDADLDDALIDGLGLRRVDEASDAIARWDLGDDALLRRYAAHAPQRAATRLYTRRADLALALARRVRASLPATPMRVGRGVNAAAAARVAAFAASELRDLEVSDRSDFGAA